MEDLDLAPCLQPTLGVDSDHPDIRQLAERVCQGDATPLGQAIALFTWVRDQIRYIPYAPFERVEDFHGVATLARGYGFCTHKSALLIALARAMGIPARFHFADLVNHAMPDRMESVLQSNRMVYHTFVDLHLSGCWWKVTPSFEEPLCRKMGWQLVSFDGTQHGAFAREDLQGRLHIDYVLDRGSDPALPHAQMVEAWRQAYGEPCMARWEAASAEVAQRFSPLR